MATLSGIGINLLTGTSVFSLSLVCFGLAIRLGYNDRIAPRTWSRPKQVLKNALSANRQRGRRARSTRGGGEGDGGGGPEAEATTTAKRRKNRSPYWYAWIPWSLRLTYEEMITGIPCTGTRQEGNQGPLLKCTLDGIVLIRMHEVCLKVSFVATILCTCVILPLTVTAKCETESEVSDISSRISTFANRPFDNDDDNVGSNATNITLAKVCRTLDTNLTNYEITTLAHIPSLEFYHDKDLFSDNINFRLYVVVLVAWIIYAYTCSLLWKEWIDNLALRRVYYFEYDHYESRMEELQKGMDLMVQLEEGQQEQQQQQEKDETNKQSSDKYDDDNDYSMTSRGGYYRPPYLPHPELRELVPNISLYSVLYRLPKKYTTTVPSVQDNVPSSASGGDNNGIPSSPTNRNTANEEIQQGRNNSGNGNQNRRNGRNNQQFISSSSIQSDDSNKHPSLQSQLHRVIEFFDQCVPNQPGYTSSVAAVTVLPDAHKLNFAWTKWYKCTKEIRRLRFIRMLIRRKLKEQHVQRGEEEEIIFSSQNPISQADEENVPKGQILQTADEQQDAIVDTDTNEKQQTTKNPAVQWSERSFNQKPVASQPQDHRGIGWKPTLRPIESSGNREGTSSDDDDIELGRNSVENAEEEKNESGKIVRSAKSITTGIINTSSAHSAESGEDMGDSCVDASVDPPSEGHASTSSQEGKGNINSIIINEHADEQEIEISSRHSGRSGDDTDITVPYGGSDQKGKPLTDAAATTTPSATAIAATYNLGDTEITQKGQQHAKNNSESPGLWANERDHFCAPSFEYEKKKAQDQSLTGIKSDEGPVSSIRSKSRSNIDEEEYDTDDFEFEELEIPTFTYEEFRKKKTDFCKDLGFTEECDMGMFLKHLEIEQISVYAREFARRSGRLFPYGVDEFFMRRATLEKLRELEAETITNIKLRYLDLMQANATVNRQSIDKVSLHGMLDREISNPPEMIPPRIPPRTPLQRPNVRLESAGSVVLRRRKSERRLTPAGHWQRAQSIVLTTQHGSSGARENRRVRQIQDGRWNLPMIGMFRRLCFTSHRLDRRVLKHAATISSQAVSTVVENPTYAVVTFTSRQAAIAARQCLADGRGSDRWKAIQDIPTAPLAESPPFNCWSGRGLMRPVTLAMNDQQKMARRYLARIILFLFCFFYTVPLTFASSFLEEESLNQLFKILGRFHSRDMAQTVAGLLTGSTYTLFLSICPHLFKMIADFGSGAHSASSSEDRALQYYWLFMLLTAFTTTSLATMLEKGLNSGLNLGKEFQEVLRQVAAVVPTQISATWINWIIVRTTIILPFVYLLQCNTFIFDILRLKCLSRAVRGGGPGGPVPFRIYVDSGVVFLCVAALAPASPLVAPVALLYFLVFCPILRWLLIFVYRPYSDAGGQRWPFVFQIFISAMIFAQIILTTMMVLKQAPGPSILAGISIVPTYFFNNIALERFLRAYQDAGLLQTSRLDGWDGDIPSSRDREEYRNWLVDCHKASYVPVCLAGVDTFLTAEPAVVIPTAHDTDLTIKQVPSAASGTSSVISPRNELSPGSSQLGATFRRTPVVHNTE